MKSFSHSTDSAAPPWLTPRAAYIHVPFCAHHCGYCDFAVATGAEHQIDLYLEALEIELSSLGEPRRVETVFIGGGTPTHLSPRQLDRLMSLVRHWLLPDGEQYREFSIESTPESIHDEKLAVLVDGGVDRVSIGVQSFHGPTLAALDRRHRADDVPRAIEVVAKRIVNWSLDLIFGAPGQTLADWQHDIEQALSFGPRHISTYGLTYEKGTPIWKDREHGRVQAQSEDDELAMYEHALDRLAAAGLEQYEVSNHAIPGSECRHNQTYWANFAYFGFGVGAARYVEGRRELNTRSLATYLRRVLAGESPIIQSEALVPADRARETLAVQMRRRKGIDREGFAAQTGFRLDDLVGERLSPLVEHALICDDGRSIAFTRRGFCVADAAIADLLAGA